jgi:hypothetical protein
MLKTTVLFICLLGIFFTTHAQQVTIRGQVSDSSEKKTLPSGIVSLLRQSDTVLVNFVRTGKDGKFEFPKTDTGSYFLLVTYPRFADYMEKLTVNTDLDLGAINLTLKSKVLSEVVIRSGASIRIKGDTTEFVADSFKLKEGATVEDLLKKLPGFTVNSKGEIVAQGKRVDKVLVDGEEFFGDDPTMATQNISGKAVDRVQLYDTKTDQQQLTGITTGNEGKTVNIKLKEDFKKGAFGKIYGGSDFNKYVDAKVLYNQFVGKRKISVYGTKTNINTGSLNWEEREKLGIDNDFEYDEISGYYFSFGGGDDFNDWSLRGLPDAYTAGALFSNKWNADKNSLNTSYRFNRLATKDDNTILSQNLVTPTSSIFTNTNTKRNGLNQQHVLNAKYEWKVDSLATIRFTSVNTRKITDVSSYTQSTSQEQDADTLNQNFRDNTTHTLRNQSDNQVLYKQLFKKKNRQWQTTLRYGVIDDDNEGFNNNRIRRFSNGVYTNTDTTDQQKLFDGHSTSIGVKSTFSEPLSAKWTMVLEYAYNKNHSVSLRNTYERDFNGKYEVFVPEFSNNFELDAYSHSGNGILRYVDKKFNVAFGSGISAVKLKQKNLDDQSLKYYNFLNLTPQMQFVYTIKPQYNVRFNYRGTTRQPTINQLQPLRDNTDQLNEYIGNPNLKVGFNHNINVGINRYKVLTQEWLNMSVSYNIQENAIAMFNTFDLQTGKRTYTPVNVDGNRSWNFWGGWNKSMGEKKPTYSININGNGGHYVNFVNGVEAITTSASFSFGLNIWIESPDKYRFSLGPQGGYNSSKSTIQTSINNNYFTYGARFDGYVMLPLKLELNSTLNADLRQRIQAFSSNTNVIVWNAGLSRKIFKDKLGKITFYANDILNDNKGFTRTINSTMITDDRFLRVSRYFLLKFEWSFNKMPGGEKK